MVPGIQVETLVNMKMTLKPLLHNKLDSAVEVCLTLFYIVLELIAIEMML